MNEKKSLPLKSNFHTLSRKDEGKKNWAAKTNTESSYKYFAIERGNRFVRRFKLYFRDGQVISIPYAFLPVIKYDPNNNLIIQTGELKITIYGRSLNTLADWFNEEKVIYIKESNSGIDDEESAIFILKIQVDGELIN